MVVEELIARVLRQPPDKVTEESNNQTLKRWDSFNQIHLVTALEETFAVKFTTAEILKATSVRQVKALLQSKGVPSERL